MGDALGAVDEYGDVVAVGGLYDVCDGVDGSEGVVDVPDGNEFGAGGDELFVVVEQEVAVGVAGDGTKVGASFFAYHLPGYDVGVVVEDGDDDFVAGIEKLAAERLCDEVDAFGGAAHKEYFVGRRGVDEASYFFAGFFVGVGGSCGECVRTTMDIAVVMLVIVGEGVDDGLGLLGGGAVVEPDEGVMVHVLMQCRKVATDVLDVEDVMVVVIPVAEQLCFGYAYAEAVGLGSKVWGMVVVACQAHELLLKVVDMQVIRYNRHGNIGRCFAGTQAGGKVGQDAVGTKRGKPRRVNIIVYHIISPLDCDAGSRDRSLLQHSRVRQLRRR